MAGSSSRDVTPDSSSTPCGSQQANSRTPSPIDMRSFMSGAACEAQMIQLLLDKCASRTSGTGAAGGAVGGRAAAEEPDSLQLQEQHLLDAVVRGADAWHGCSVVHSHRHHTDYLFCKCL